MSLTTDLLNSIGSGISLSRSGGPEVDPGQVVSFVANTPDLSNVTVPVVGQGAVSVTWLAKSVRFMDALPAPLGAGQSLAESLTSYLTAANVLGGTPIAAVDVPIAGPPLKGALVDALPLTTVATSPAALPAVPPLAPNAPSAQDVLSGVPGMLGQIAGSIPVLMNAPVSLTVTWDVSRNGTSLVQGTDYLAPSGLTGPSIPLIFAPVFKELGQEATSAFTITAKITLSAGGESVDVAPPPLTVTVPDLGLPRVAAMFRHSNFAPQSGGDSGFVFVMVPGGYPFRTLDELSPVLTKLQTTLSTLHSFVSIAGFLTGLGELVDALPAQPSVQFRAADSISDLEDVVFESHWYGDYDADEEISSVILLGVPNSTFEIFNEDDFDDGDGKITLTTGAQMWAALTSFSFHDQNEANDVAKPDMSVVSISKRIGDDYNDEAESVRFTGAPIG